MKKYIFTESQIKKIIDSTISEQMTPQKDCFFMAFDNHKTTFDNGYVKNGDLYFSSEMNTYKCGKASNVMNTKGPGSIDIIKKNGVSSVMFYGKMEKMQINFEPTCQCVKVK